MVSPFEHLTGHSISESQGSVYTSHGLRLFLKGLEQERESRVLDVGPVCGENISFLARSVKRLYVCDMLSHLGRSRQKRMDRVGMEHHLDYPPQSFDGILLWNVLDHLDDQEAGRAAALCYTLLKPGGMVLALVAGTDRVEKGTCAFVAKDGCRLNMERKPDMDLPLYVRNNREVLQFFHLFLPVRSFLYQVGVREYFFRRD